jgi:hypothetical protein
MIHDAHAEHLCTLVSRSLRPAQEVIRETRLLSRNEKDFGGKFPEVIESISELKVRDAIIDGEIVALDEKGLSSFQLLQAFELGQERPQTCDKRFRLPRRQHFRAHSSLNEKRRSKSF